MSAGRPIRVRGRALIPGAGPFLAGILNVTPDSFSDGGSFTGVEDAVTHGLRLVEEGADLIDVGGESTRPGSLPVPPAEQLRRVLPVIEALAPRLAGSGVVLSIDTRSAEVAGAAIDAGVDLVNDASALGDDAGMAPLIAGRGAGVVLMHMRGTPLDMQAEPRYDDVVGEVLGFLRERVDAAGRAGIARSRLIVDPGIGFGKTTAHNLALLRDLGRFREIGVPVMVGPSRKRFIGEILDLPRTVDRDAGTAAVTVACVLAGAEIIRVHDVAGCRRAAKLAEAIRRGEVKSGT